ERLTKFLVPALGVAICFFTLAEVNFNWLKPVSARAMFILLGLVLCFLTYPAHRKLAENRISRWFDLILALAAVACCGWVFVQNEPIFNEPTDIGLTLFGTDLFSFKIDFDFWQLGKSLAERAGEETQADFVIGLIGLLLILEATRRAIGWIVPALALAFVAHAFYMDLCIASGWTLPPDWMLPNAGLDLREIVFATFQQGGVFGSAAKVMFKYVFLFVVFGAYLEISGATQFIIDFSERLFGRSPGGPAKVSVLGSGLMGSLSGSAVANAVTTGSFTIPMMRKAGFDKHIAGGITAAAAAGGALVPPVMGAGAYMMLELLPQNLNIKFLDIARAALIPAVLYYLSIFRIVDGYSKRISSEADSVPDTAKSEKKPISKFEAFVFFGALTVLIGLLIWRFTPFRAVTASLVVILLLSSVRPELKLGRGARIFSVASFVLATLFHHFAVADAVAVENLRNVFSSWLDSSLFGMFALLIFGLIHREWRPQMLKAMTVSSKNGVSLVAASACVGIIIGVVDTTGIATLFSQEIKLVVQESLFLALLGIMSVSLVLGMGVPSVVCYLLMATMMGNLLEQLGVPPLAAHLFIFYFGMMSMVTPPVALAAYASASIAEAPIMKTAFAAFRFSLVGFTLPFMFIYRPELLLMNAQGESAAIPVVIMQTATAIVGIYALAAGLSGYLRRPLGLKVQVVLLVTAALTLFPDQGFEIGGFPVYVTDLIGLTLFIGIWMFLGRNRPTSPIAAAT
ncbi:MAG: TRAP transporter fused permease subunit, partial [Planctomycetaceae bacterium]